MFGRKPPAPSAEELYQQLVRDARATHDSLVARCEAVRDRTIARATAEGRDVQERSEAALTYCRSQISQADRELEAALREARRRYRPDKTIVIGRR